MTSCECWPNPVRGPAHSLTLEQRAEQAGMLEAAYPGLFGHGRDSTARTEVLSPNGEEQFDDDDGRDIGGEG